MRTIAVITGTRAEYGILKPVLERLVSSQSVSLSLIATGMHLSPQHGMTISEIEQDGFTVSAKVDMQLKSGTSADMGVSTGIGIQEITKTLDRLHPDIVLILGDRIEAFAGAVSGLFCGSALAHIHGGDVSQGGWDEYMRHAITKLSHIHFAATPKSIERILRLGEAEEFVHVTGTPGLDAILSFPEFTHDETAKQLGIPLNEQYALVVQHPVSTHPETASEEMNETLTALEASNLQCVLIYPNADAGSQAMMDIINQYEQKDWVHTFASIPRELYCNLLRQSAFLIGNSSSGMIDAPAYGTPVINIGERQAGRERGTNIIDVSSNTNEIQQAIQTCLHDEEFKEICRKTQNPYGDGKASERIVQILETVDVEAAKSAKRLPW